MSDKITHIGQLKPDERNANKGTARGQKQIVGSIQRNGFGRSGLLDKTGRIIAGNKTTDAAVEVFGVESEPIIIQTDGKRPVYVQRTDLDLDDPDPNNPARRLAYEDNLASYFSFELDPEVVSMDMGLGFDFEAIDVSLSDLSVMLEGAADSLVEGDGKEVNIPEQWMILIECTGEQEQAAALEQLTEMGYQCKALVS